MLKLNNAVPLTEILYKSTWQKRVSFIDFGKAF